MDKIIKDGKSNILGVDIQISDILGEKIINQYISQLSEQQMSVIFEAINDELFDRCGDKIYSIKKLDGYYHNNKSYIWDIFKDKISTKFGDIIAQKAEEIINSEEFQKKTDDIANEIVEYATNGYKEDLKNRVKERLVGNLINEMPMYDTLSLRDIIHREIQNALQNNYY